MRYRTLDAAGDMRFGHGQADFLIDNPEAVAQAIGTRLRLWTGEWFLDLGAGTAWLPQGMLPGAPGPHYGVVGMHTQGVRDQIIQERIRNTPGVARILSYQSLYDPGTRSLAVAASVLTIYGPAAVEIVVPAEPPLPSQPMQPFILAEAEGASAVGGRDALLLGEDEPVGPIVGP